MWFHLTLIIGFTLLNRLLTRGLVVRYQYICARFLKHEEATLHVASIHYDKKLFFYKLHKLFLGAAWPELHLSQKNIPHRKSYKSHRSNHIGEHILWSWETLVLITWAGRFLLFFTSWSWSYKPQNIWAMFLTVYYHLKNTCLVSENLSTNAGLVLSVT